MFLIASLQSSGKIFLLVQNQLEGAGDCKSGTCQVKGTDSKSALPCTLWYGSLCWIQHIEICWVALSEVDGEVSCRPSRWLAVATHSEITLHGHMAATQPTLMPTPAQGCQAGKALSQYATRILNHSINITWRSILPGSVQREGYRDD